MKKFSGVFRSWLVSKTEELASGVPMVVANKAIDFAPPLEGAALDSGECQIRSTSSYSFQRSSEKQPACFADGCDRYLLIGGAGKTVFR